MQTSSKDESDKLREIIDVDAKITESREEKIYDLEKCLVHIKGGQGQKDDYILNLRKSIIEIKKKNQVYICQIDDEIDLKIAEFIHDSKDSILLTQLFLREDNGVYSFGTKRVFAKIENGKVFIRYGGGYQTLEQFVNKYSSIESEKITQKDSATLFLDPAISIKPAKKF